jgi:Cu+-exporting ATPase
MTREKNIVLKDSKDFDTFEGQGIFAFVDEKAVLIGNRSLFREKEIAFNEYEKRIQELENQGKTVILVAVNQKLSGLIAIADPLSKQVGIDSVLAEVMPADKSNEVKKLQKKWEVVAFVGDGINDAPALAQADVGIAIGSGTDVAIESGEVVLMKDDLLDVVSSVQLSQKVMQRIKQNLFWAFAYNSALIPVAAGVLYPPWGITFRPEFAGFAMAMSSVTVVSLSLMLKKYVPPAKRTKE